MFVRRIAASACAPSPLQSIPAAALAVSRPRTRRPAAAGRRRLRRHQVRPAEPAGPRPPPRRTSRRSRATRRATCPARSRRPARSPPPTPATPATPEVAVVARRTTTTTNGWQIAAWAEAAVLAALAAGRRRPDQRAASTALAAHGRCRGARRRGSGAGAAPPPRHVAALPAVSAPDAKEIAAMLTRRIAASACALCLAVPTAATAKPTCEYVGHVHHTAAVVADRRHQERPARQRVTSRPSPATPRADLPGAIAPAPGAQHGRGAAGRPRQRRRRPDDGTGGWRLAAVIEAAVSGPSALGAALLMTGRRHRAPRMGV